MNDASSGGEARNGSLTGRAIEIVQRLASRRSTRNPKTERRLVALAAVIFVVATVFGIRGLPDFDDGIRWMPLLLVGLVAVPLTVVWNGVEYAVTARILDHRVPVAEALRVSVLSSAANLLPIPGAVVVKTRALSQLGSGYGQAVGSTAVVGLAWLATSFAVAGAFLIGAETEALAPVFLAVGLAGLGLVWVMLRRRLGAARGRRTALQLLGVEVGFVLVLGLRMYLVLLALGYGGVAAGFALALAAVVATASGFFPGGFGLREVLAGGVGPLVGIPAAVGVVVAAIDRIIGLIVLTLVAVTFVVLDRRPDSMVAVPPGGPDPRSTS